MNSTTLSLSRPALGWLAGGLAVTLLATALVGAAAAPARAQTTNGDETLRTLSVNGIGRVNAVPDVADVSLGVFEQAKEAAAASQQAAASMDAVVQALLGLGIDEKDIQTTSISLNASYDWEKQPAQIVGWEARNMVIATVRDIEAVGDVVDAAVGAGANQIDGISFRVEDPTEAEALARTAAVEDARAKADQLAADAGVEIVGIVSISESGGQQPQPIYMAREEMAFAADAGASTPVLPGEVELSVNVFIQYEIA
ncbi:MAG: SIMPL domain-containing protein [Candidatus Limnocylindrales bacterium]